MFPTATMIPALSFLAATGAQAAAKAAGVVVGITAGALASAIVIEGAEGVFNGVAAGAHWFSADSRDERKLAREERRQARRDAKKADVASPKEAEPVAA